MPICSRAENKISLIKAMLSKGITSKDSVCQVKVISWHAWPATSLN